MTITFKTLGCKVNQYETQLIREQFAYLGYQEVEEKGDVYLINTCSVTAVADRKSRHLINSALKLNPKPKVIVIGCGVNNKFSRIKDIKGIDLKERDETINSVLGARFSGLGKRNLNRRASCGFAPRRAPRGFPRLRREASASDKLHESKKYKDFPKSISYFKNHNRAFIKIQDGCNNYCSFCIIPYLRGRSCSRDLKEVVREAKQLVDNGFQEIILCGIDLGAFGKDIGVNLVNLIEELEKIKGIERIRLSSLSPQDIDKDLIAKFKDSEKLCSHLHISLQSGDDSILKKMNRFYTGSDFLNLTEKIRKIDRLFSFTTDILVGFPGEGEKEFLNTLKLVKEIGFSRTHIFSYSPRQGTKAADFSQQVSSDEIKARVNLLKEIAAESSYDYRKKFLNQDVKILVEDKRDKDGYLKGYSEQYVKVFLKGNDDLKNKLISVRIDRVNLEKTFGVSDFQSDT